MIALCEHPPLKKEKPASFQVELSSSLEMQTTWIFRLTFSAVFRMYY